VKLIRCTAQPSQVDDLVAALEPFDISHLTVTGGTERRQRPQRVVYRGVEYEARLAQTALVEIAAADQDVDAIIRVVLDTCNPGEDGDEGRIVVLPVLEWYAMRHRRIA